MSLSNLIYLGVGVGLGVAGSHWLFRHSQVPVLVTSPPKHLEPTSSICELISPLKEANHDIPTLLQQLQQTQLAYQMAHQMSQFKAGFLVRISHELRSPLNSLIGLHQLILTDLCDDPAEEREFVAQAHQSALKLVKLIDEILEVARTEHGNNQLEIQPLQLADVLQQVYNLVHLLAANRNFRLQLLPPESQIYIFADPHWLRQVLLNLLDTCIIQMEEGSICVSAQAQETGSVQIWLDAQMPASIWAEPVNLMQSDCAFSEPLKEKTLPSPGLALLLNQTLMEVMKGRLEVLPVPGETNELYWTRIQLTIPLVIPENASLGKEEDQV